MAILLGVDFDNTIVCYDQLFHRLAVERQLIPPEVPSRKASVRDYLRTAGREGAWTELQGYVYGPGIAEAAPFDGVVEFLTRCSQEGIGVRIVSHKTRQPFIGPPHDLHGAAASWLAARGFFDAAGINLSPEHVFFGVTKDEKLRRIADLGCTHFIDDLPELLSDPSFPFGVERILFDPAGEGSSNPFQRIGSWRELTPLFFEQPAEDFTAVVRSLLAKVEYQGPFTLQPLDGGGNNRVFRIDAGGSAYLLKQYFDSPIESRDRLNTEFSFAQFAWKHGIRSVAQPFACDPSARLAIYEFVAGTRPTTVTGDQVEAALTFYRAVNKRRDAARDLLPMATDAWFSLDAHAAGIAHRVESLSGIAIGSAIAEDAAAFVRSGLRPAWERVLETGRDQAAARGLEWQAELPEVDRRLSPSDFGFHNALIRRNGDLVFLDFEYAGWDDPAKLVVDFFCHPALPVPSLFRDRFTRAVGDDLDDPAAFRHRVEVMYPMYQIRWVCIMLNDFLPQGTLRRQFARRQTPPEMRQAAQLAKARQALDTFAVRR